VKLLPEEESRVYFHPELSGRENIYLNGSILGLKKKEIDKQFDAIVDFSGIEKFLDTPLKRYSSGMQLRLAFAVAAHLEPEVLVIDEVLAVGDAEFQKKCIGKMSEVSSSGRTILFVSHNMGLVSQLCNKAVVLKGGEVAMHGNTNDAIDFYLAQSRHDTGEFVTPNVKALSERPMFFNNIKTQNDQGVLKSEFSFFEHINLEFKITLNKYVAGAKLGFAMLDRNNARVFSEYFRLSEDKHKPGEYTFKARIPQGIIAPGNYSFLAALLVEGDIFHLVEEICSVRIIDTGTELAMHEGYHYGSIILKCDWE
jgi:lipopolysaccharide transport system ATP-binding protein